MTWISYLLVIDDDCVHFLDRLYSRIRKFEEAEIRSHHAYRGYIKQQNAKILNDIRSMVHQIDQTHDPSEIWCAINHSIPDCMRLHVIVGLSWRTNSKTIAIRFISYDEMKTIEKLYAIGLLQYKENDIQSSIDNTIANGRRLGFVQLSWIGFAFMKIIS